MLSFKTVNSLALGMLLCLLLANYFVNISLWFYVCLAAVWFIFTVIGSFHIRWDYHLKSLNSNKAIKENRVAITFDDGPHPEFTPMVLSLLKEYHTKATFFCIGKHVEQYPELFKSIIEQGHTVGNHTYSHSNAFGFFKTKKVVEELQQTNAIVKNVTGLNMSLYRPAFGVTNPRIRKALKITGLQSIGWNVRSLDTTSRSSETVLNRITKNLSKGDVILLHDSSLKTVTILEQLLLFLKQQNLESVSIDSLFKIKAYA